MRPELVAFAPTEPRPEVPDPFSIKYGVVQVLYNGRPLQGLPRKEIQVLALLLKHAGRLVSKKELADEIWPERRNISSSTTLESTVCKLRNNLKCRIAEVEISTESGGYILLLPSDVSILMQNER